MKLPLYIAKRYLFSKKSHNAINIISLIAVCGVAVATLATVCTLSVFNGFQGLVADMFSSFDPELKITAVKGKVFEPAGEPFLQIRSLPEIAVITETLEDNVLVKYKERQVPVVLKGVSDNFSELIAVPDILFDGEFQLQENGHTFANLGIGVASNLGMNAQFISPLTIYAPKRNAQVNLANPMSSFNVDYAYIASVFRVSQPVYDDNYIIVSLDFARELLDYSTQVGAWEIRLKDGANLSAVQKKIRQTLGDDFEVKNRYEQQESAFKMISIEKWVTFLMLCFILLIAVFNVIGSLSMLLVDKKDDIQTLRHLGADNRLISNIFLLEGWLISTLGTFVGIVLGVLLCLGQSHFGWIKLGGGNGAFATDFYPVKIEIPDLLFVLVAALSIGFLAALYPVKALSKTK
ncbi:membrane protein [Bacteroidia bacterium]|nr:membrane protein [Bacteroidia bacterium]